MIAMKTSASPRDVRTRFVDEQAEFKCFFKGLLVFVFGWPLIASLIVLIGWELLDLRLVPSSNILAISNLARAADVFALAYAIVLVPAIIIGMVICGLQARHRSFGFIHVLLIALALGGIFAVMESPQDGYSDSLMRWSNAAIKLIGILVATLACWAIACRWRMPLETSGA
jgi:hypothetical protein